MPRKKLIQTSLYPYHVVTRANNQQWFSLPLKIVWSFVKNALVYANRKEPVKIHSIVLMSNHYHLLVSTPHENISKFMEYFNKRLSDQLRIHASLKNRVFGGRYNWSLVSSERYLLNVIQYIYKNPVRANICSRVEDYPYSTIHYLFNSKSFPVDLTPLFDEADTYYIDHFNRNVSSIETDLIRKGLRRSEFTLRKDPNTGIEYQLSDLSA